jgi:hypothetical protein
VPGKDPVEVDFDSVPHELEGVGEARSCTLGNEHARTPDESFGFEEVAGPLPVLGRDEKVEVREASAPDVPVETKREGVPLEGEEGAGCGFERAGKADELGSETFAVRPLGEVGRSQTIPNGAGEVFVGGKTFHGRVSIAGKAVAGEEAGKALRVEAGLGEPTQKVFRLVPDDGRECPEGV